ncbi:MAG: squalene synthase HpnC [Planctomyces sp.]|nr:squalene synthase HpnC [Planctomyces sp.]
MRNHRVNTPDPSKPIVEQLGRFGPGGSALGAGAASLGQATAYARALTLAHYENFSVLSSLVPRDLRDHFAAVYAFCRWADDLGDETWRLGHGQEGARDAARDLLAWWRGLTEDCWLGRAQHPVFVALRRTAERFALPVSPFLDLIDAFEQDQRVTVYQTWDQLLGYCARSASPVGRIVLMLGGHADTPPNAELYAMSDATCTALQLTNFWQDVRRDLLERSRVYMPVGQTGLGPQELRAMADRGHDPEARVRFIRSLRPLVERTRELFDAGAGLPKRLGGRVGPVVWLLGAGGRAVLGRVESIGCATLWRRPRLSGPAKAWLIARAWARAALAGGRSGDPHAAAAARHAAAPASPSVERDSSGVPA